jgi:hypothetical protein
MTDACDPHITPFLALERFVLLLAYLWPFVATKE